MKRIPNLEELDATCDTAVAEVEAANHGRARGGPEWDPFRQLPEYRLTAEAQNQLLQVYTAAATAEVEAEDRLARARSDRSRSKHSRRVYMMSSARTWAQEVLMASVSLLLVKRVQLALRRHNRSPRDYAEDYMADALACALGCMETYSPTGPFHLYVASSVDATLSQKLLEGSVAETLPQAWQVALRHIPSIEQDLEDTTGRIPSNDEVGNALLGRARKWAEARIVEKGGDVEADVLDELVDAKLTKQGMFSAVRNIGTIRAATAGSISLDAADGDSLQEDYSTPGADLEASRNVDNETLQALLQPMPYVTDDLEIAPEHCGKVRELLESSLWHTLATGPGLPVEDVRVDRTEPDLLALI